MERNQRERKQKGGLGDFDEESYGIAMQDMEVQNEKAKHLMEEEEALGEQVIQDFKNEELIKKDEDWANEKRKVFSFGGESVRNRMKRRRDQKRLTKEVNKIDRMMEQKRAPPKEEE